MTTGAIKDDIQVRLTARALWSLSRQDALSEIMDDLPDWPGRVSEGWILGAGHAEMLIAAAEGGVS